MLCEIKRHVGVMGSFSASEKQQIVQDLITRHVCSFTGETGLWSWIQRFIYDLVYMFLVGFVSGPWQ